MRLALLTMIGLAGCEAETPGSDAATCAAEPLAETWTGPAGSTLTIVSTDPSPPARFDNTWVVRLVDADGADIDPAEIAVSPFMPAHGHGATVTPVVEPVADGLRISPLDLWMPGEWEVRFDVPGERIIVLVCIPR